MSLSETRLGPYEIQGPLGAGGMGEVYRALDSRLKRQVALKMLPPALAADPDRLARFQREAEVLASLNHPHIAGIYGLEDSNGVKALVMELVEGPTLADRIAQGPIPIEEALPIARQIAEALEAAHAQGIIHRDLKPANIKVREDGTVKVLDFGLAKLTETGSTGRPGAAADSSDTPTLTSPAMTAMGVILGTVAYMSPEQARGRAVDKRTDIWAFGAVLYEMLTGARAFEGEDVAETIASVVKSTPNWPALATHAPPVIVNLVQRCLDKDRNARISEIAIARFLLSDQSVTASGVATATVSQQPQPQQPPQPTQAQTPTRTASTASTTSTPWTRAAAFAGITLLIGGLLGWLLPRRASSSMPVTHLQLGVAPADRLIGSNASVRPANRAMALTPDGRTVVFVGLRGNVDQLFTRSLDRPDATPVAGTNGATTPFLSPDGAWIGFIAENTVKKVPIAGGPIATIAELPPTGTVRGATWADDGNVYVSSDGKLYKAPAAGGTLTALARKSDGATTGERDILPQALPGSKQLLFTDATSGWDSASIVVESIETGERRVILQNAADARLVGSSHLLFMKVGTLMAVPFDPRSLQVTGTPVPVIDDVMQSLNMPNGGDETGAGQFVVSSSGTLLYIVGGISPNHESVLTWVDRSGKAQPLPNAPPAALVDMRLSPDGQRIVATVRGKATRNADLWVYDVQRGSPTRLTVEGGGWPVWSSNGSRVVYGHGGLNVIAADGSGKPERLTSAETLQVPSSWSSSANVIAFLQRPPGGMNAIWILPMSGDRQPHLLIDSRFSLRYPEFSPDGRWIAYASTESGTPEVYVQPYPGPGAKVRLSTTAGFEPVWNPNGREILYRSATLDHGQFFSVNIRSTSPFQADPPRLLFETPAGEYDSTTPVRSWDITPDGQRFLLLHPVASNDKPITSLHIVLNWTDELNHLVPSR